MAVGVRSSRRSRRKEWANAVSYGLVYSTELQRKLLTTPELLPDRPAP